MVIRGRLGTLAAAAVALALYPAAGARAAKLGETTSSCPKQARAALPLPADAELKAAKAALAAAPALYKGLNVKGATIVWSKRAAAAGARGGEVAYQCGRKIQARTLVVELRFPKELPSSSLSEGVLFVSRFKRGYEVWEIAH
jgi:hypothetical protein